MIVLLYAGLCAFSRTCRILPFLPHGSTCRLIKLQEAKWLLDQGLAPDEKCAARAIGYRQAMAFLHRCRLEPGHASPASLVGHAHLLFWCACWLCWSMLILFAHAF